METNKLLVFCIIIVLTIGCQSTESRDVKPETVEKHIWEKAELDCNATDIDSAIWEKHGNLSAGVLFTGLRSVRSGDLENIVVSSKNYSIIIYPVRVVDEGVYNCLQFGDVVAVYNLTVRVVPQLRIQHKGFNVSYAISVDTMQDIHLVCIAFQSKSGIDINWITGNMIVQEYSKFTNVSENEFMAGTYNFEHSIIVRPSVDFANITCIGKCHENLEYAATVFITLDESRGLLASATSLTGFLILLAIISLAVIYYFRLRRNRANENSNSLQSESYNYALPTKARPSEEEEKFSTDTVVRDEEDVGDVVINSYFAGNKHQGPYDRQIKTPYGGHYRVNQHQASSSYERKIKTSYFIKEGNQEEEYSAIDDEM